MNRLFVGWAVGLSLASGLAGAQQVWKCDQDGQVVYTDQPCEKRGRALPDASATVQAVDPGGVLAPGAASAPGGPGVPDATSAPGGDGSDGADPLRQRPPAFTPARERRLARAPRLALQGLMNTDFVQRGYVPRRQNPSSTPNP